MLDDLSTGHADAVPAGATFSRRPRSRGRCAPLCWPASRRGAALRGQVAGRRVGAQSPRCTGRTTCGGTLALLEAMRVTGDAPDRVLLDRGGLRRTGAGADRGDRSDPADQPVRGPRWRWTRRWPSTPRAARVRRGQPALLQRGRGASAVGDRDGADGGTCGAGERHTPETHLIPDGIRDRGHRRGGPGGRSCSATTTRPRTGPASGTTSTCSDLAHGRTCRPWRRISPARTAGLQPGQRDRVRPTWRCWTCAAR